MAESPLTPADAPVTTRAPNICGCGLRWAVVLLAAVGAWISFDLTRQSIGYAATNPLLGKFCSADAGDCASVLQSEYGRTAGIPTAVFGLGYFVMVGLWFALVGRPRRRGAWMHLPIALATGYGALQSLLLTLVMANVLHRWCVGCATAHVVNFLILLIVACMWLRPKPLGETRLPLATAGLLAAFCANSLCVLGMRLLVQQQMTASTQNELLKIVGDPEYVRWSHSRAPRVDIPLRDEAQPDQRVVICFFDLECAVCPKAGAALNAVKAKYGDRVYIEYRHYPLNSECNPAIQRTSHPAACAAARAAEAVRIVGGDEALSTFRDAVYARRAPLTAALCEQIAAQIGIDAAKFEKALEDARVDARIAEDIAVARTAGVNHTPTVYLDGREVITDWSSAAPAWDALLSEPPVAPAANEP
ncbi:MAG: thioredoxin domain-containing protein [Phycisphaerales bacterium]|nr:thioredoxin domain-containing protein [Phycisphaerales bacterium]